MYFSPGYALILTFLGRLEVGCVGFLLPLLPVPIPVSHLQLCSSWLQSLQKSKSPKIQSTSLRIFPVCRVHDPQMSPFVTTVHWTVSRLKTATSYDRDAGKFEQRIPVRCTVGSDSQQVMSFLLTSPQPHAWVIQEWFFWTTVSKWTSESGCFCRVMAQARVGLCHKRLDLLRFPTQTCFNIQALHIDLSNCPVPEEARRRVLTALISAVLNTKL